jgi:hypothetical protein
MAYKKYLIFALIAGAILYPEYILTGLGVIVLVIVILFFVVDLIFDLYIFVAYIMKWLRERQ